MRQRKVLLTMPAVALTIEYLTSRHLHVRCLSLELQPLSVVPNTAPTTPTRWHFWAQQHRLMTICGQLPSIPRTSASSRRQGLAKQGLWNFEPSSSTCSTGVALRPLTPTLTTPETLVSRVDSATFSNPDVFKWDCGSFSDQQSGS